MAGIGIPSSHPICRLKITLVLCNINFANWNNVYGAFLWHHFYPKKHCHSEAMLGITPRNSRELSMKYQGMESRNSPRASIGVAAGERFWNAALAAGSIKRPRSIVDDSGQII